MFSSPILSLNFSCHVFKSWHSLHPTHILHKYPPFLLPVSLIYSPGRGCSDQNKTALFYLVIDFCQFKIPTKKSLTHFNPVSINWGVPVCTFPLLSSPLPWTDSLLLDYISCGGKRLSNLSLPVESWLLEVGNDVIPIGCNS